MRPKIASPLLNYRFSSCTSCSNEFSMVLVTTEHEHYLWEEVLVMESVPLLAVVLMLVRVQG